MTRYCETQRDVFFKHLYILSLFLISSSSLILILYLLTSVATFVDYDWYFFQPWLICFFLLSRYRFSFSYFYFLPPCYRLHICPLWLIVSHLLFQPWLIYFLVLICLPLFTVSDVSFFHIDDIKNALFSVPLELVLRR